MYMRGRDSPVFATTGSRTSVREKNDLRQLMTRAKIRSFVLEISSVA
jgi:hypothetical protein